jgi:hypothetical protein
MRLAPVLLLGLLLGACATAEPEAPAPVYVDPHASRPQPPDFPQIGGIVGMGATQVSAILGEPALQRRERPAQYWRYSYAGCTLDLFLYADPRQAGQMKVLYYELRQEPRPAAFRNARCADMQARLGPNLPVETGGGLP